MKRAAIVIGRPNAGKSTTVREFKKLVKMITFHKFTIKNKYGYILSNSFEEAGRDVLQTIKRYASYDLLVFTCQGAKLAEVHKALKKAQFKVCDVYVQHYPQARDKAKEVLVFFKN